MLPDVGRLARVTTKILDSANLADFYAATVSRGHEGIVIRNSETFKGYKAKPIHSIDAVIIGAVEGMEGAKVGPGMLASALVALRDPEGKYHIITKVGSGLDDTQRVTLWNALRFANQPNFVTSTSDGRSFRMVQPEIVVEVDYLDIISQDSQGSDILQTSLQYDGKAVAWNIIGPVPFVSLISPRFSPSHPIREDKTPSIDDLRLDQVTDLVDIQPPTPPTKIALPPSTILARYVFAKGNDMVRKYIAWQTNKQDLDASYPGYVVYSLDYSANRAEPLKRSVAITSDLAQLWELFEQVVRNGIIGATGGLTRGWSIASQLDTRRTPMELGQTPEMGGMAATGKTTKETTAKPANRTLHKANTMR